MGSATTGVLKGVQAVTTFVASHYAFCSVVQSQCFSVPKAVSLVVVLLGVMMYSLASRQTAATGTGNRGGGDEDEYDKRTSTTGSPETPTLTHLPRACASCTSLDSADRNYKCLLSGSGGGAAASVPCENCKLITTTEGTQSATGKHAAYSYYQYGGCEDDNLV